jgi:hypothetical protein
VKDEIIELVIDPGGTANCIYTDDLDDLDLARLGEVRVRRASAVEPDDHARWWADLAPVGGPKVGPFRKRTAAVEAEVAWLRQHWLRAQGGVNLK